MRILILTLFSAVLGFGGTLYAQETKMRGSDTGPSWGDPANGIIGFSSRRSGNYDLYIKHLASNRTLVIVQDSLDQHYPVWSPDGSKIAYQSKVGDNNEIFLMDVASRTKNNLTNHKASDGDDYPCWSVDGQSLYFTSNRNGNRSIYKYEMKSGKISALFNSSSNHINPSISPDGKWMAYSSDKGGNYDIYLMRLDGSEEKQITSDPSNEMFPSWFPSGNKLLFQRRSGFRQSDFFSVDLDGRNEKNLTNSEGLKFYPKLSADGEQILYMSGSKEGTFIFTFEISTGKVSRVTGNGS